MTGRLHVEQHRAIDFGGLPYCVAPKTASCRHVRICPAPARLWAANITPRC